MCLSICGILFSGRIPYREFSVIGITDGVANGFYRCPSKAQCYSDVYDMEYVEPLIPDYISDNPFRNMKNDDDFFEGFDLPGEPVDDDEWDEGFDLPGESVDENEEGDEEEEEDQEQDVKLENSKENVKEDANEDENEDSNFEDFDFDGPWDDSKFDDLPVADPHKDTKVKSPPVHGLA